MKETILNLLKTKFVGVSDTILEGLAERAARTITTEDAAKSHVDGLTIQNIIDSYTESRVYSASKNAVLNYEKKHGLKDGKAIEPEPPTPQPTPTPKPDDDTPAWAKALIEANNNLRNEVEALKLGKTTETRSGKLQAIISQLTPTQQKAYSRINVADMDESAFDAMIEEIKTEVNTIVAETKAAGAVTKPPLFNGRQGTDKEASDEEVKAMMGIK